MASLAVLPALQAEAVESAVLAPRRAAEAGDRGEASGRAPKDRVTISAAARERAMTAEKLDAAQQAELAELRSSDLRVRAHERAHQAAAGGAAGAASFQYVTGPDGKQYAVAGEVPIRVETGDTPDETIAAAQRVRAAALAPADPSAQDLAVAAEAARVESTARAQKSRQAASKGSQARDAGRAMAAYQRAGASAGEARGSLLAVGA